MNQNISLDGSWRLAAYERGLGERQGAHKEVYDVRGWLDVRSPAQAGDEVTPAGFVSLSRSEDQPHWMSSKELWYRTEFTLSPDFPRENAKLVIDQLPDDTTVWINGVEVGCCRGDKRSRLFEVGHVLVTGPNSIALRVDPTDGDALPDMAAVLQNVRVLPTS